MFGKCAGCAATRLLPTVRTSVAPSVAAASPRERGISLGRDLALEGLGHVADVERELLLLGGRGGAAATAALFADLSGFSFIVSPPYGRTEG